MDDSNMIIPPHRNAEVYKAHITNTDSMSNLDYIKIHTDGTVLIGCSDLTGRYWNGGAGIFSSVTEFQNFEEQAKKSICLTSGTPDGCFIVTSNKILLCEDTGSVSIWSSNSEVWHHWTEERSVAEHDGAAMAVDCLENGKEYVTVGSDGNIKVWDINDMICFRNYKSAHCQAIYGIAVRPQSTKSFASASLDKYISLWDENVTKPVLDVVNNNCGVYCLQWLDENTLLYGDEAGVLSLVDLRNVQDNVQLHEFPAPVHKIVLQHESSKVAVCCDNRIVYAGEINEDNKLEIIYKDENSHSDYVRGAAWDVKDSKLLHTSGWDGAVITHRIK